MAGQTQWERFGWHGIALDVPSGWCPGRLEGDFASGYVRVEDETDVRLELRWESAGRRPAPAAKLVDNYVKQVRRKTRRTDPNPEVTRDRYIRKLDAFDHEVFTWRGAYSAHSLIVVCPETRRVVHLRVFFTDDDDLKKLTRRIFASLVPEPRDGQAEWSAFGLRFQVGSSWRLEESGLRTGCLRFLFGDGTDELEVVRFSLAELLLRQTTLAKWFTSSFAKALRKFRYETQPCDYGGAPAVRCAGVMRWRARPMGLFRRKRLVVALAWHRQQEDKILVVRLVSTTPNDPRLEAVAGSITSC